MLVTTVDKKIKFYQRVILMIMLVFMPFYSVGSDFFLEGFPSSSIEVVENGVHEYLISTITPRCVLSGRNRFKSNSLLQTL